MFGGEHRREGKSLVWGIFTFGKAQRQPCPPTEAGGCSSDSLGFGSPVSRDEWLGPWQSFWMCVFLYIILVGVKSCVWILTVRENKREKGYMSRVIWHISWSIRGLPTPIQVPDPYMWYVRQVQDPNKLANSQQEKRRASCGINDRRWSRLQQVKGKQVTIHRIPTYKSLLQFSTIGRDG